ncbi:MAG TPA: hypothetical protein VND19_14210 [Acetobacteraceae bacterium]|nr:hypothetical protein [Acetobacteraceae bacterium]
MDRCSAFPGRPAPCKRDLPGLVGPLAYLGLLILSGCAGGSAPQAVNAAALAQRAYASNGTIRSVSDALDQRLDLMLAVRMDGLQP